MEAIFLSINLSNTTNLSMLMDFYELTMSNAYFENGMADEIAVYDMFFRTIPDGGGFAITAGLEQFIEYIESLSFSPDDINYLRSMNLFSEDFLKYLENFTFSCDIWAMPEGTPVFPNEPIMTVRGPLIQAQLIETMLLLTMNHQSLIATKANRIVRAAQGRPVMEFGARRAHGYSAAVYGARASYIAGVDSTSCVLADSQFGIPVSGTMAHSMVQSFDTEYEAFALYARTYPENCILLVDTYSVLKSGVPNAIRVFNEVVLPTGNRPVGIRIDSGDIAYLSKKARIMLDEAGFSDVKIVASNSLDEYIISDLIRQGAALDSFGVGENLITSKSTPVFGGVYKLVASKKGDEYIPRVKLSESSAKITTPGFKEVYRFFNRESGKMEADLITLHGETIDATNGYTIFDPIETWKIKDLKNVEVKRLQEPIFKKGKLVYECPSIEEIRTYCLHSIDQLWEESRRFEYPHRHYVDMSQKLWDLRYHTLVEAEKNIAAVKESFQ